MRINPLRPSIRWILIGGIAFWLPMNVLYAVFRDRVSVLALNLAPLGGLALLEIARRVRRKGSPQWGWVLAGIYILGPLAMEIAPLTAGGTPAISQSSDWLWLVLFALLPPVTLWFATLYGMIIAVLFTTVLLIYLADRNRQQRAT